MQRFVVSVMVVALMVAIGLGCSPRDFSTVWKRRIPLLFSLFLNLTVVPGIASAVVGLFHLSPASAVGILICAASPAGPAGPLFALRANGHAATAVTVMVLLVLLSVFTTPLTISWLADRSLSIDLNHLVVPMIATLCMIQLIPLLIGMLIRHLNQPVAERLSTPARQLANILLILVVGGLLITKGGVVLQLGVSGLLLCALLVLINLAVGALSSNQGAERRTYSAITGVRNISLALLVSSNYFSDPATEAAVLTYGLVTTVVPLIVTSIMGALSSSANKKQSLQG